MVTGVGMWAPQAANVDTRWKGCAVRLLYLTRTIWVSPDLKRHRTPQTLCRLVKDTVSVPFLIPVCQRPRKTWSWVRSPPFSVVLLPIHHPLLIIDAFSACDYVSTPQYSSLSDDGHGSGFPRTLPLCPTRAIAYRRLGLRIGA